MLHPPSLTLIGVGMARVAAQKADLDELRAGHERAQQTASNAKRAAERSLSPLSARRKRPDEQRDGIARAIRAYRELDKGEVPNIRVRTAFIRRPDARTTRDTDWNRGVDIDTRPPMSRLIAGAGSRALPTYLTMVYLAHLRKDAAGRAFDNDIPNLRKPGKPKPWVELAGMYRAPRPGMTQSANRRRLRVSLNTALDTLADHQLVTLTGPEGSAGRYEGFTVLSDSDTEDQYVVPGEGRRNNYAIRVPATFFFNGWHLVLTPSEIAVLLAIIDRTGLLGKKPRSGAIREVGVDLKESERWGTYGLSGEAYASVHMLKAFGIIDVIDPMANRARPMPYLTGSRSSDGTVQWKFEDGQHIPFRLLYPPTSDMSMADTLFDEIAFDAVMDCLDDAIAKQEQKLSAAVASLKSFALEAGTDENRPDGAPQAAAKSSTANPRTDEREQAD